MDFMASTAKSRDNAEVNALSLIGDGESFKEELCQMLESAQIFNDFSRSEIQTMTGFARAYAVDKGTSSARLPLWTRMETAFRMEAMTVPIPICQRPY